MRKPMSITLEENIILQVKRRAIKKHLSASRVVEEILRTALRLEA